MRQWTVLLVLLSIVAGRWLDSSTAADVSIKQAHDEHVSCIDWNPRREILATCGGRGEVRLWDASRLVRMDSTWNANVSGAVVVRWSPNGEQLAAAGESGVVSVFDVASQTSTRWSSAPGDETMMVRSLSWSPDGRRLATVSLDRFIRVWDVASGKKVSSVSRAADASIAWRPGGRQIASADYLGEISLWSTRDWTRTRVIRGAGITDKPTPCPVTWSSDGRFLAYFDIDDESVVVLNSKGHRVAGSRVQPNLYHSWIAWQPRGRRLAYAAGSSLVIWDPFRGTEESRATKSPVTTVAWSSDGTSIAAGCDGGTLVVQPVKVRSRSIRPSVSQVK
jgi:WD40 repeat protein